MNERKKSKCRSCEAAIYWFKTRNDKRTPVDAATVTPEDIADDSILYDHKRHVSHFSSCPNAKQHRKK